jgi:Ca-activated chloride channel homolog
VKIIDRTSEVRHGPQDHDGSVPGRHRHLHRVNVLVAAAAVGVVIVAGGSWVGYRALSGKDCTGGVRLRVTAAPEIAPVLRKAADRWSADACSTVDVVALDPPDMAAIVAGSHGVNLLGVGARPASGDTTDVWVADSSTWLLRLAAEASGFTPANGASIAESPVVMAVPSAAARTLPPALPDLLKKVATDKNMRPGIVNPARDAAGLAGLLALGGAAGDNAALKVGVMRAFATNSSNIRADMLQKFPKSAEDDGAGIGLAPLSEEDVIAYNAGKPAVELTALYPAPTPPALDYPYAVMPGVDPDKSAAAALFFRSLSGDAYVKDLAAAGLRASDGVAGAGFPAPAGAPATVPPPARPKDPRGTASVIAQLLGSWSAITQPGRQLAVFDVSGSMKDKVPTAGGLTRAQVTQKVATDGLALLDDRWSVGNWVFSTEMNGKLPWRENVPISSLATSRSQLQAAIGRIVPKSGGDTGLFDTAVAAYRTVRDGWEPGKVNSVVLFTDGKNDNPAGLKLNQAVDKLKKLRDPTRPVRVIIIGIGTGVDKKELKAIAEASGSGGVWVAEDPARIGEIFLQAIASRSGA